MRVASSVGMTPREFWGMVKRGKRVGPVDRQLLRAVAYNERTRHSCGHSVLDTTNPWDKGHFKLVTDFCEACAVKDSEVNPEARPGDITYVVDKRD